MNNNVSEKQIITHIYPIRRLTQEMVQSMESIEVIGYSGNLGKELLKQCQSKHKYTLRGKNQLINIKKNSTESLEVFQGRAQKLTKRI